MPPESTTVVEASGSDTASLLDGFGRIGMPPNRQADAHRLVDEIVMLNSVERFEWYKPAGTNELSCYWDGSEVNLLWITPGHVHVRATGPVVRPARRVDWEKAGGEWVGWTLPGFIADDSVHGGSKRPVDKVPCPRHLAPPQPVGAECPECCEIH